MRGVHPGGQPVSTVVIRRPAGGMNAPSILECDVVWAKDGLIAFGYSRPLLWWWHSVELSSGGRPPEVGAWDNVNRQWVWGTPEKFLGGEKPHRGKGGKEEAA